MSYGLCYVCDEYPPVVETFGGMGVAFREQAETFARLGRRVDVICRTDAQARRGSTAATACACMS